MMILSCWPVETSCKLNILRQAQNDMKMVGNPSTTFRQAQCDKKDDGSSPP